MQQQQQPIVQMPAAQVAYALPGQLPGQQLHVIQQQQILGPQQFMGLHQPQPTYMQIGNNLVPVMPQQILQPIPLQHAQLQQHAQLVQHNTPQHIMQAASGALPPVSPAHPGWVAQPQQQPAGAVGGAGPMLRASPGSPAVPSQLDVMRGPPPPAAGRSSAGQQQLRRSGSPMPTSGQLTSDALSQLLSNLAGTGVLAKGGGGAAEDSSKVQKVKDFQPAFLKVLWAGSTAAAAACAALRQHVQRRRSSSGWAGWVGQLHPLFVAEIACLAMLLHRHHHNCHITNQVTLLMQGVACSHFVLHVLHASTDWCNHAHVLRCPLHLALFQTNAVWGG
jgi:hypothetical protein